MASQNSTSISVSEFELVCFPGIQSWQHWLSVPLSLLFMVTISANITLVATIYFSPSLHKPMYFFLCLLAVVDLLLVFSISPKSLAILWFKQRTISSTSCFSQTFFAFFCQGMEASVLMFLAYDRYIAICNPLRYSTIITNKWTAQAITLLFIVSIVIYLPFPFLAARLQYCIGNTVSHCLCESQALAEIGCGDTRLNYSYALSVVSVAMVILTLVLAFSYTMIIRAVLRLSGTESALKTFSTCSSHLIVTGIVYCFIIVATVAARVRELLPRYVHIMLTMLRYLTFPALNPLVYGIMICARRFKSWHGKLGTCTVAHRYFVCLSQMKPRMRI